MHRTLLEHIIASCGVHKFLQKSASPRRPIPGSDTAALQTQDSTFEPWRSEAEHATSRSWRLSTLLNTYEWAVKKHFFSLKLKCKSGGRTRDLRLSKQAASTTELGPPPIGVYAYTNRYIHVHTYALIFSEYKYTQKSNKCCQITNYKNSSLILIFFLILINVCYLINTT